MARPNKQVVDYFSHDTDASEKKTLTIILSKYGNDGYAFWFMLLELLGRTPGHYYNYTNPIDWEFLLAKTHVSDHNNAIKMLETFATLGAIDGDLYHVGIIWSQNFVDRLSDVYARRKQAIPTKPELNKTKRVSVHIGRVETGLLVTETSPHLGIGNTETGLVITETPQSKLNYSKLNNTKVLTPKGVRHTKPSKQTDPRISQVFSEIHKFLGYSKDSNNHDPIPNYGKEGKAIKRMLLRGFTPENIVDCWKKKVSQRNGDFVSMVYVNEDIGKKLVGQVSGPKRQCSTDAEIAASIKEATTWHGDK